MVPAKNSDTHRNSANDFYLLGKQRLRDNTGRIRQSATPLAEEPSYQYKRIAKRKRFHDETRDVEAVSSQREQLRINTFFVIADCLLSEREQRGDIYKNPAQDLSILFQLPPAAASNNGPFVVEGLPWDQGDFNYKWYNDNQKIGTDLLEELFNLISGKLTRPVQPRLFWHRRQVEKFRMTNRTVAWKMPFDAVAAAAAADDDDDDDDDDGDDDDDDDDDDDGDDDDDDDDDDDGD
ncbi:hypothetical protein EGW08_018419 [Elysia chlorotica]|uniref:Uncharacterized protein n=1 Tax=Elysia chlorotica TaxID=188477 RepID=A0A433SWZ6_ELYCH|nr:hypothetical protein EGW08_018419 [Elysia chlorotica]